MTNIESQTCGALLLNHVDLHCPSTLPSKMRMSLWQTEKQLYDLLHLKVDVQENREMAMENSWKRVVERIMEALK